jgi:hypothetical protein
MVDNSKENSMTIVGLGSLLLLSIFWVVAGIAALVTSVVCFGKNSTTTQGDNIAGLVLALFLGPFYWIFYFGSSTYCK